MSNLYTTQQKIELAYAIVAEFKDDSSDKLPINHMLNKLNNLEHKYIKSSNGYCDIRDFCIPLAEITLKHYKLMLTIGWIDSTSRKPMLHIKGFYELIQNTTKQGIIQTDYFITVNAYVKLLLIELELSDIGT